MIKLNCRVLVALGLLLVIGNFSASSQTLPRLRTPVVRDRVPEVTTTQDTTLVKADSLQQKGDITTTIKYSAKDSIESDNSSKIVWLYGDAKVDYGDISLKAAKIKIDYNTNTVDAEGVADTTGKLVGIPVFKNKEGEYQAHNIKYNFKTKKGYIQEIVTQQGEGYIHGNKVGKDPENNLYIKDAVYTTCNLAKPHFHINAGKIKVVHDKQIVTGPFNLVISDVPTPLGFAFGIFPFQKKKPNGTSGIIVPTYGEEPRDRGFFLRNGGYYWAVNEHLGMRFLGEIYAKGGWGLQVQSEYKNRYHYNGRFDFRYNRRKNGDEGFQEIREDFWITWSHMPESRGTGRFSANVNAGTSTFNQRNALDIDRRITPSFNSNVSYSNSIRGLPINYGVNIRHDMNTQTRVMNLTLPDFNLNINRIYPFKSRVSSGSKWYETIGFTYTVSGGIRLSNAPVSSAGISGLKIAGLQERNDTVVIPFNIANASELWRRAQIGAVHSIPVSMSLKLFKYFNLSPSFNYQETWYPQRFNYSFNPADSSIVVDTLRGFSRTYSFNAGAGLTTNIYGTFNFGGNRRLQAIRHRMIPTIGFSYQPDFSRDAFGFYQQVLVNGTYLSRPTVADVRQIPRYQSLGFGSIPGPGRTGSISFSLGNTLEAKLRPKSDSAGAKAEKVSLLDNFNISASYNMARDSLNLSNINLGARTRILKTDVNFGMSLDPYLYAQETDPRTGRRTQYQINEFAWKHGMGLGQVASANMFFSKSFSAKTKEGKNKNTPGTVGLADSTSSVMSPASVEEMAYINANRDKYVDFNVPWTFSFSYSLAYNKRGFDKPVISQTLSFNGDVSVTEKWKISFNSGYDFISKGITNNTSIGIHRDLHCWDAVISWIPFGTWQSYTFDLRVKASILQDLKLSKRRTWYDR